MLKKLLAAVGAVALVLGLVALVAGPASAHTPVVTASCTTLNVSLTNYQPETNVTNPNHVTVWTDGTKVDDKAFTGSFTGTYAFTLPQATHSYEVKVFAWDDPSGTKGWSVDKTGTVTNCTQSVSVVTAPTQYNPYCTGAGVVSGGGYTIPTKETGITFQVGGKNVAAGPHDLAAGASVTIDAVADTGYTVTGTHSWTFTLTNPDASKCLVPAAPTLDSSACSTTTAGSHTTGHYTIPATTSGVRYTLGDGTPLTGGTSYDVTAFPSTVEIVAVLATGYSVPSGTQLTWTFHYDSPGSCFFTAIVVQPTVTQAHCDTTQPGVTTGGSYTLNAVTGLDYRVTLNGSTTTVKGGGTFSTTPGDVVDVVAIAESGYQLSGAITGFPVTFTAAATCLVPVISAPPTYIDPVCDAHHLGAQTQGSYTLVATEHISYQVSVNKGAYVSVAAGSHDASPGDVVVIKVVPDTGYVVEPVPAADTLTFTFTSPGDCLTTVSAVRPAVTSQSCVPAGSAGTDGQLPSAAPTDVLTDAFITIPNTVGVQYYIDTVAYNFSDYAPTGNAVLQPGIYQVTAAAKTGYTLDPSYPVSGWTETLTSASPCGDLVTHPLVQPTASQVQLACFAGGSYTLANDLNDPAAVTWSVNGATVAPGTYKVSGATVVKIHAEANGPNYGLESGAQQDWTFAFASPSSCDLTTLAFTGSSPTGGIALGYLLLVSGLALLALRFVRRRGEPG